MKQKYFYDPKIFSEECEKSFYWAGFIAADGSISQKGDFTLSLKIGDIQHLNKFKEDMRSAANITIFPPREKTINNIKTITSGTCIIRFRAKYWLEDLKKFNIVPNKTKTYTIPLMVSQNSNFKHFIRGYFDGDGWFSIKHGKKSRLSFGLCGNLSVLQLIQKHLKKYCNLESAPCIYKQSNIFKFEFQNQHDVYKICKYLYYDAIVYLNRKYELSQLSEKFDNETIILNLDKQKLFYLYNRLKSYKLVAQELGCAKSTIAKYMKKYNISALE